MAKSTGMPPHRSHVIWPDALALVRRPRRATVLAIAWLVALAVAATAPALFGERSLGPESLLDADPLYAVGDSPGRPPIFDPTRVYFDLPRDFAAAAGFGQGRLDLWNPRIGLGRPQWADGGALFFPPKVLFYLWPSRRTYDAATACRLVIAGVGAFLLARRRGLGIVPAAAAGSLFELSGAMLSTLPFGEEAPPCLLPWVVLGADVIAQDLRLSAAVATGLALGLAGASGHVMFVLLVWAGFAAAIAGHVLANWRRARNALTILGLAAIAVAIALALAAPALLPFAEALQVGREYKSTSLYETQFNRYLNQTRVTLPVALFGSPALAGLRPLMPKAFPQAMVAPTVGVSGLIFALAGVPRGLDAALLSVGLLGLGLTVTPPVLGWVRAIPFLHYVYPMYAWSLVALPLTQAAGRGIAALSARGDRKTIVVALGVVSVAIASLPLVGEAWPETWLGISIRVAFGDPIRIGVALLLLLIVALVAGLVVAAWRGAGHGASLMAAGLVALELLVFVAPTAWYRDSLVLGSAPSEPVRYLQQALHDGQFRMLGSPWNLGGPGTHSLFGLPDVRGVGPLPVERYARYLQAIAPAANWYVWQGPGYALRHPLLDLAAVRYVVTTPGPLRDPLFERDPVVRVVYRDASVVIYENRAAFARARIVHGAVAVRDQDEAFRRLTEAVGGSPHAGPGLVDRIFVEPSDEGDTPVESAAVLPLAAESVRLLPGADPDEVQLEANLSVAGWVVLADTVYPGWQATVDGVPTPIHPADLLFRAVAVGPGTHRIVFRYRPRVFYVGLGLAAVTLVVAGVVLVRAARKPPRSAGWRSTGGAARAVA